MSIELDLEAWLGSPMGRDSVPFAVRRTAVRFYTRPWTAFRAWWRRHHPVLDGRRARARRWAQSLHPNPSHHRQLVREHQSLSLNLHHWLELHARNAAKIFAGATGFAVALGTLALTPAMGFAFYTMVGLAEPGDAPLAVFAMFLVMGLIGGACPLLLTLGMASVGWGIGVVAARRGDIADWYTPLWWALHGKTHRARVAERERRRDELTVLTDA